MWQAIASMGRSFFTVKEFSLLFPNHGFCVLVMAQSCVGCGGPPGRIGEQRQSNAGASSIALHAARQWTGLLALGLLAAGFVLIGLSLGPNLDWDSLPFLPTRDVAATTPTKTVVPVVTPTATSSPTPSPTPDPTASPTPSLTSSPTPTPTPQPTAWVAPPCAHNPGAPFVLLWTGDRELCQRLGCPIEGVRSEFMAEQTFQRGHMVWRESDRTVFILYDHGLWESVPDRWQEGMPEYSCGASPPAGLLQPKRGFGLVWCDVAGVRESLGWAFVEEVGYTNQRQVFERGEMLVSSGRGAVLVWLDDGSWLGYPRP